MKSFIEFCRRIDLISWFDFGSSIICDEWIVEKHDEINSILSNLDNQWCAKLIKSRANWSSRKAFIPLERARFDQNKHLIRANYIPGRRPPIDAQTIAAASKSTSGTGCSLTTQTTTARGYLWIGSYSPRAASADAIPPSTRQLRPPTETLNSNCETYRT